MNILTNADITSLPIFLSLTSQKESSESFHLISLWRSVTLEVKYEEYTSSQKDASSFLLPFKQKCFLCFQF